MATYRYQMRTSGGETSVGMMSSENVLAAAQNGRAAGAFDENEEILAYLPMAWVGDYAITVAAALLWRFTVNVPERQETVVRDMREIAPTFYLAAPRSWDQMLTTIQVGIENSTPFKKWLYQFFMDRAVAAETRKLNGKSGGALEPLGRLLGEAKRPVVVAGSWRGCGGCSSPCSRPASRRRPRRPSRGKTSHA